MIMMMMMMMLNKPQDRKEVVPGRESHMTSVPLLWPLLNSISSLLILLGGPEMGRQMMQD